MRLQSPNNFELQPHLSGKLLELRPLRADDFEALFASASDPLIWEQHPQPTRYLREVFQGFFDLAMRSGGAFAVIERQTELVIGSSRYYDYQAELHQITVGYTFLARKFWGGPYNRELKTLMLEHAFRFVDFVLFEIGATNLRSRRAIERIGARLYQERVLDLGTHLVYRIDAPSFRELMI